MRNLYISSTSGTENFCCTLFIEYVVRKRPAPAARGNVYFHVGFTYNVWQKLFEASSRWARLSEAPRESGAPCAVS